jgi:hypothetical protein
VEFAPTGTGAQTGTVSVVGDSMKTAVQISLAGTGVDFTVTPLGAISQTVSSGQLATYNLTITPLGGVQAVYALQCGTLPAHTLCAFSPASIPISGAATGTVAVLLTTGQATAALSGPERRPSRSGTWRILPVLCGVLLFPLALRRGRIPVLAALFAILVGGAVSCVSSGGGAGGSSGSSSANSTSAGTYAIPVTVSSNGISHSVTLTLLVD